MNISSFFKILNRKIEKYDKLASNPFETPHPMIIIWIEEAEFDDYDDLKNN